MPSVIGAGKTEAKAILRSVKAAGFVTSLDPETPVRITFPLAQRARLFPGLFEDEPNGPPGMRG